MRNLSILLIAGMFFLVACGDKEDLTNAEVEINCTGIYLSFNHLYYKVCNTDILLNKVDGDKISVNIKHLDECEQQDPNETICTQAFQFEGFIKILYQF